MYKELIESLSNPDISKKEYDSAVETIEERVDNVWRHICRLAGIKLDWWAFQNDASFGHGDGSTGGFFNPETDLEFIEIVGERGSSRWPNFEYEDGFPTEFLWSNYEPVVLGHIEECKRKAGEEVDKKKSAAVELKNRKDALKEKLKNILSKEELKLISFK